MLCGDCWLLLITTASYCGAVGASELPPQRAVTPRFLPATSANWPSWPTIGSGCRKAGGPLLGDLGFGSSVQLTPMECKYHRPETGCSTDSTTATIVW